MKGEHRKAYLALLAICIIWGTTFLTAKMGVKGFPPLLFMGTRHFVAGLLLGGFCLLKGSKWPGWKAFAQQILPGIFMVMLGNGIVGWAVQYIPSGLAALICAMMPVYIVVINLFNRKEDKLNYKIVLGLLLGISGLLVIFRDNLAYLGDSRYVGGIIICLVSCLFWALGSFYSKRRQQPSANVYLNVAMQLVAGGAGLLLLSSVTENWSAIHHVPLQSVAAISYLIVFGSITAFVCFHYALSKLPIGVVTLYAYINPLVAILLGYIVLHEPITYFTLIAFVLTLSGVFLVNAGYRQPTAVKSPSDYTIKQPSYE
ncbi:Permease of the drug/metabolite transporter (DMT) superfamily [Filimonas lacunae]|uniref:Permease of the drug/metabolite transporter (DMT) superfamily n=1 Tax=Filimonas lacunae TaxID=477680 RepID=A0A173MPZ6_9BACT|nr:EamA family transporter [Filimonas lacunae]BAV09520.1 permease of the drug/metabolite transporter (DMT) superfamily [Filimonas lacunae]SIS74567.1 Permease of the drug/metabolite transporter (DMT) superfamily [Filimonas lacunae]